MMMFALNPRLIMKRLIVENAKKNASVVLPATFKLSVGSRTFSTETEIAKMDIETVKAILERNNSILHALKKVKKPCTPKESTVVESVEKIQPPVLQHNVANNNSNNASPTSVSSPPRRGPPHASSQTVSVQASHESKPSKSKLSMLSAAEAALQTSVDAKSSSAYKETWPSRRDPVTNLLVRYTREEYIAELKAAGKSTVLPPEFRFAEPPRPDMAKKQRERLRRSEDYYAALTSSTEDFEPLSSLYPPSPSDSSLHSTVSDDAEETAHQTAQVLSVNPAADLLSTLAAEEESAYEQFLAANPNAVRSTKTRRQAQRDAERSQFALATTEQERAVDPVTRYEVARKRLELQNLKFSYKKGMFVEPETGFAATALDISVEHHNAYMAKKERDEALGLVTDPYAGKTPAQIHEEFRLKKRLERPRNQHGRLVTHKEYRREQYEERAASIPKFEDRFPHQFRKQLVRQIEMENYNEFVHVLRRLTDKHADPKQAGEVLSEYLSREVVEDLSEASVVSLVYSLGKLQLSKYRAEEWYQPMTDGILAQLMKTRGQLSYLQVVEVLEGLVGLNYDLNSTDLPDDIPREELLSVIFNSLITPSVEGDAPLGIEAATVHTGAAHVDAIPLYSNDSDTLDSSDNALSVSVLSRLLSAMVQLRVNFGELPSAVRAQIVHFIIDCPKSTNAAATAQTMKDLSRARFDSSVLTAEQRNGMVRFPLQAMYKLTLSKPNLARYAQMIDLLQGLVTCEADFDGLTVHGLATISSMLESVMGSQISTGQLVAALHLLSRFDAKWHKLSEGARAAILSAFTRIAEDPQSQSSNVFLAIKALSSIGAQWSDLSPEFITSLEKYFVDNHSSSEGNRGNHRQQLSQKKVLFYLHHLAAMGASWTQHIPEGIRSALVRQAVDSGPLSGRHLAFLARSLAQLRCTCDSAEFHSLRAKLSKDVACRAYFEKPQDLSSCLSSLGKIRVLWFELPTFELENEILRLGPSLDSVETSLLVRGLSHLQAEWTDLSPKTAVCIQHLIEKHADSFSRKSVGQLMKAMVYLAGSTNYTLAYNSYKQQLCGGADSAAADVSSSVVAEPVVSDRRVLWNAIVACNLAVYSAMRRVGAEGTLGAAADSGGVESSNDQAKYAKSEEAYVGHLTSRLVNKTSTLKELLEIEYRHIGSNDRAYDDNESAEPTKK